MIRGLVRVFFAVLAGALVLAVGSMMPVTMFTDPGYQGLSDLGLAPPRAESDGQPSTGDTAAPSAADLGDEDIPAAALAAYQQAADIMADVKPGCGLSWTLLAAIGRVESDHGRADDELLTDRSAGPMRIRPTTWNEVGVDGDGDGKRSVEDIDDAALATAVYLCSGSEDLRELDALESALRRWSTSDVFLEAVLTFDQLYRDGDFTVVGKNDTVVLAAGLLSGPSLSASPFATTSPLLASSPRRLPPGTLSRVLAETADAVQEAGQGGPISTEAEAAVLPTTEVTPSEVASFVAGQPVGQPPEATTPTEQPVEVPTELPPSMTPEPTPTPTAPTDPLPTAPTSSDPVPTGPSEPAPSDTTSGSPSPSEPAPSDPTSPDPSPSEPSAPAPSEPAPSDPTSPDPSPSDPATSEPPPPDPAPSDTTSPEPSPEPPPPEPSPSDTTSSEPSPEPPPPEPSSSEPATSEPSATTSDTSSPTP